jgi:hypothetical protein
MKTILRIAIIGGFALFVAAMMLPRNMLPPSVQAQGFEPFSKTFYIPAGLTTTIIPACTTGSSGCIPNYKQVAHQISDTFAGSSSASNCGILIDGSTENSSFFTLAALPPGPATLNEAFVSSVNGYFPYVRLKAFPCSVAQTITYVGFSTPLPFLNQSFNAWDKVSTVTSIAAFPSAFLLNSFSCSNNAATAAYLQVFFTATSPTLGTGFFYEFGLPANSTHVFPGPAINSYASSSGLTSTNLYAGAVTTQGGSTAVGTPIDCNFQLNPSGPFFPFNPPSP